MDNKITFSGYLTINEKLYDLVERIASTHYPPTSFEANWYLERFVNTARALIEEYNTPEEAHGND